MNLNIRDKSGRSGYPPIRELDDLRAESGDLIARMAYENGSDSRFRPYSEELFAQGIPKVLVEGRERLVEEKKPGAPAQGPREGRPLLLPSGELARKMPGDRREARKLEEFLGPSVVARGILYVAVDGHMRKQRVILEHEPDRSPLGGEKDSLPRIVPGLFAHLDAAGIGMVQPREASKKAGLAAARGTSDPEEASLGETVGRVQSEVVVSRAQMDPEIETEHAQRFASRRWSRLRRSTPP